MATLKQQKTAKILIENSRKSVSAAMREAGYSPATATHPKQLTSSDGWKELMDKHFSDEKIAKKIEEGLDATRVVSAISGNEANGGTTDFIDVPDFATRHKYIETAVKLKGKIPKDTDADTHLHLHQHFMKEIEAFTNEEV